MENNDIAPGKTAEDRSDIELGASAPGKTAEDPSDLELDAVVAATAGGLLTTIRRSLDLDAGLTQIMGAPSRQETSPQLSVPGLTPADGDSHREAKAQPVALLRDNASDISSQIARLRFQILELAEKVSPTGAVTTLLRAAAANLKDLNRGLEARELTRSDAHKLLTETDQALRKALDAQKQSRLPRETGGKDEKTWGRAASLVRSSALPFVISMSLFPLFNHHLQHNTAYIIATGAAVFAALTVTIGKEMVANLRSAARDQRTTSAIVQIRVLRVKLKHLKPGVMRLFDDADDFSPQCVPFV